MAKRRADPAPEPMTGAVEAAVRLPDGNGWLLIGWTPQVWAEHEPADRLYAQHSFGTVTGDAWSVFHPRSDIDASCVGFCMVLLGPTHLAAKLMSVELAATGLRLPAAPDSLTHDLQPIVTQVRRIVHGTSAAVSAAFLDLLPRPAFDGAESVSRLWPPVQLVLDQAVRVGAGGLVLAGSLIDTGKSVAQVTVCAGDRRVVLDPEHWLSIRRPELLAEFTASYGVDDDRVGFLAYAAAAGTAESQLYIEVQTTAGAFGFKPFRVFESPALGVIKQVLSVTTPPSGRLKERFDRVLGPAVEGLIQARRTPRPREAGAFGTQADRPVVSVLIPLYGRIDFMELQLAMFAERPGRAVEIVYILDDPSLDEPAELLAQSCWTRFKLPFRLLIMPENGGYAAANNAGLRETAAPYVCLLNSDVFPLAGEGLEWLEPLVARLERDPALGAVGPRLLFGDGTVQHDGMHYERRAEAADWWFPIHTGKGAPPGPGTALLRPPAITGACMVVRRADLLRYGGLDEGYVIGDFEDADLCQRLAADGKTCAVDPAARLYHLERQSQSSPQAWRANTTLYNAWRFNRRWGAGLGV